MPSINLNIQQGGPLISVLVGVSTPRFSALKAAGQTPPTPTMGTFLIDTGASCTCIDPDLINGLGIQPTGVTGIRTPSTQIGAPHFCDQYDVSLFIPDTGAGHFIAAIPIITTHLRSQGIDGLLGRDVLNSCILIYNGIASIITLAY
jgi:hypothetical protein